MSTSVSRGRPDALVCALLCAAACGLAAPLDELTRRAEVAALGPVEQLPANRAALLAAVPSQPWLDAGRPVPLDWLREAATHGDRPTLVRAWERLKAWQDASAPGPRVDAARVRAETAAILAGEAYQPLRTASWIDPWLPYVERFFDWLFAPFARRGPTPSAAATSLGVALYTVLSLVLAAVLASRLRRRPTRLTAAGERPLGGPVAEPDAAAWWAIAERALREERATAACAAAWRGLLWRMDETGWLAYDPSRTPRETAAAVAETAVAEALAAAAARVETGLYGGRPVTPDEIRAWIRWGREVGSSP